MRSLISLVLLTLLLAACGDPQATGSGGADPTGAALPPSGSTTAPTEGAATSSQPVDDTPIPVEGTGDIGDGQGAPAPLAQPPDFGISSETDSGSISPYTSCWSAPTGDGASQAGLCSDGIPQPDALTLTAADQLVVTYAEGELTAGAEAPGELDAPSEDPVDVTELPVVQDNPGIWLVDSSGLPPGDHVITLAWYGDQGDAFTAFTLTVQR
ncbi:MAG TPA: hypothetical protein VMM13_13160 [Euzebya sp.]|nr:hypothetical protein [Euzebya sp.]